MKTVAWRRSGDMRTSVTLIAWAPSTSSCTSPRMRTSERTWRTCSPTRSTRTEGPSVALVWGISPSPLQDRKGEEGGAVSAACPHSLYLALSTSGGEEMDHNVRARDRKENTSEHKSLMRITYAVFG